jgi:hypothetical protein
MKIEYLQSLAGHGFSVNAGDTADRPEKEALRLIERGIARAVQVERATLTLPESAALDLRPPRNHGRRGR